MQESFAVVRLLEPTFRLEIETFGFYRMHRNTRSFFLAVLIVVGPPVALADGIYTYVDANGVRVFTNVVPNSKPPADTATNSGAKWFSAKKAKLAEPRGNLEFSQELKEKIISLTDKYELAKFNLGPEFVQAVVKVESNFNANAVSRKGAMGLMQLMPETARKYGVRNVFNPQQNLEGGIRYLKFLLETFEGDVNLTLAAYNAGENIVQRLKSIPPYRETREYVKRISQILGKSQPVPIYDYASRRLTYVAWVDGKLKFTNIDPPPSAIVFDGYHLPKVTGTP